MRDTSYNGGDTIVTNYDEEFVVQGGPSSLFADIFDLYRDADTIRVTEIWEADGLRFDYISVFSDERRTLCIPEARLRTGVYSPRGSLILRYSRYGYWPEGRPADVTFYVKAPVGARIGITLLVGRVVEVRPGDRQTPVVPTAS